MGTLKIRYFLIAVALIFCASLKGNSNSPIDSLSIQLNAFIENWIKRNIENSNKGESELNQFIAHAILRDNKFHFFTGCSSPIPDKNFINGEPNNNVLSSRGITDQLCDEYRAFCNSNPSNVQNYIIIIDYPEWIINTEIPNGQLISNTPLKYLWENGQETDKVNHENRMKNLQGRIPGLLNLNDLFTPDKHRIVTIIAGYDYKANNEEKPVISYRRGFQGSEFLTETSVSAYFNTCIKNSKGVFNGADFINSTIEYFNNYVDPNATCEQLRDLLTSTTAKNYFYEWCLLHGQNDAVKNYTFKIAQYIDKYPFLQSLSVSEINDEYISMSPLEYFNLLSNHPTLDFLDGLMQTLKIHCETYNETKSSQGLRQIIKYGSDIFYNNLKIDDINCLVNYMLKQYDADSGPGEWLLNTLFTNEDFIFFDKIFKRASNMSQEDCASLITTINNIPKSAKTIFKACDHLFTLAGNERRLASNISNVALIAAGKTSLSQNDFSDSNIFIWKPGSFFGFTECLPSFIQHHYRINSNNTIEFQTRYHPENLNNQSSINSNFVPGWTPYDFCFIANPNENLRTAVVDDYPVFNPFSIVGVVGGGYVNMFSECRDLECYKQLHGMSAFHLAFNIEKLDDLNSETALFTGLQVAALPLTYEAVLLSIAAKAPWYVIAGWSFLAATDVVTSVPAQSAVNSFCLSGAENQEEAQIKANKVNSILGVVNMIANVPVIIKTTVEIVCSGYALWKNAVNANDPVSAMANYGQRIEAAKDLLLVDPTYVSKALDEAGLGSIKSLLGNLDGNTKVHILGHIFNNVDAIKTASNQSKMINLLEAMVNASGPKKVLIAKYLQNETKLGSLLHDLKLASRLKILDRAIESEEFLYMLLKAENLNIDIISKMTEWDEALTITLKNKISSVPLIGLADEMVDGANTLNLFRHFEGLYADIASTGIKEWFYPIGLKRAHLVGSQNFQLPDKYLEMLNTISLPVSGTQISTLNTASALGNEFDKISSAYLAEGMISGSWSQNSRFVNYTSVPSGYQNSLNYLNSINPAQYKILVENGWAVANGQNSALDIYCFKTLQDGTPIFTDVITFELKIDFATQLSNGQKQIGINLGGTFISPGGGPSINITQRPPVQLSGTSSQIWQQYFQNQQFSILTLDKMHLEFVEINGLKEVRIFVKNEYP